MSLRQVLMDYVGTAFVTLGYPITIMYLSRIENASEEELYNIANELGLCLEAL